MLIIFLDDLTLWAESQGWIDVSDRVERLLRLGADLFDRLPGWFIAAGLYIVLSRFYQKRCRAVGRGRVSFPSIGIRVSCGRSSRPFPQ